MTFKQYMKRAWPLYVMIVPGVIFVLLFRYYPMYGVVIAFQDFSPARGFANSPWIGWENFEFLFSLPEFSRIFGNTLIISVAKIVADQVGAIILALLLNEARRLVFRRTIQTMIYLPHFLSWIVLGGILLDILSAGGILNQAIRALGFEPQLWLGSNDWFRGTIITSGFWKNVGFSTIVYLAALDRHQPGLARSGCHRWRRALPPHLAYYFARHTSDDCAAGCLEFGRCAASRLRADPDAIQPGCLPHRRYRRYLRLPRRLDLCAIQPGGGGRFVQVIHRLHLDRAFVLDGGSFRRLSDPVRADL